VLGHSLNFNNTLFQWFLRLFWDTLYNLTVSAGDSIVDLETAVNSDLELRRIYGYKLPVNLVQM
jgi:hypothetical protein